MLLSSNCRSGPTGKWKRSALPRISRPKRATVLDVYGHLFYAGARTLEKLLPSPRDAERPVVILRLRGRTVLGATLIDVLSNYAQDLHAAKGRPYLSGLSESVHGEVVHSETPTHRSGARIPSEPRHWGIHPGHWDMKRPGVPISIPALIPVRRKRDL